MHERKRGILARFNAYMRGVLWTCAVVLGGLLVAWLALKSQVNDEIRAEIERRFAERYRDCTVSVRHARMIEGRGVEILGLSITRRSDRRPLASVNEIFAACPVDAEALLSGQRPHADHVYLSGLKLWAQCQADGTWDVQRLWPLPEFGSSHPPVTIRDATIEVTDARGGSGAALHLRDVGLEIAPDLRVSSAAPTAGPKPRPPLRISGRLAGDQFEGIEFQALVDTTRAAWSVAGQVQNLRWGSPLRASLPGDVQQRLAALASLSGRLDLGFQAAGGASQTDPIRFSIRGALSNGQIQDSRLPYPLSDVRARFELDNQRVRLDEVYGRNGPTTVTLQLERHGWHEHSPMTVVGETRQLELDRRFLEILTPDMQAHWRKYFPAGVIDAQFRLDYDGQRWTPEATVTCHDASFAYYRFPYRLERARGTVKLKDDRLQIDLIAAAGGQDAFLRGEIQSPGASPIGWMEFGCRQPIPIDEKLLAALIDPHARDVVRALRPSGMLTVQGRFERLQPGAAPWHRHVDIELVQCGLNYERFPYPLAMIRGQLVWDDQGWTFQNLNGRNDTAYVEGAGYWRPVAAGGSELVLNLTGTEVPLEDELRDALQPGAQRLWNQLHPRGTVDHLTVGIHYASASKTLDVEVTGQKLAKKSNDEGYSITLQPSWFPYRLDDVTGLVHYSNGRVQLRNISAWHDETQVSISGACGVGSDGSWTVQLPSVVAERIRLNRDLLAALPKELGKAAERLTLHGDLCLQGSLAFSGAAGSDEPAAAWDLVLDVEDGSLQCGFPIEHLHGDIRLVGSSGNGTFSSRGELQVDSVMYRKIQLTGVSGPLLVDPSGIVFGTEADGGEAGHAPRALTAQTIGGQLSADIRVGFEPELPYRLQVRLERGDLAEFASEMALASQSIRGRANALLTLSGNRFGWPSWRGTGAIRLFEADIYEIPVMLAMLKLLSIRQPDTTAFTSSEIDFRVQGEHVYLDRVNFNGDAVSLKGNGEMDLAQRINLNFYSLVGSGELNIPVVRTVLRQASRQLLLIHVTGTLEQPQLTREPLPLLRGTLEQIFPEAVADVEGLSSLPVLGGPSSPAERR